MSAQTQADVDSAEQALAEAEAGARDAKLAFLGAVVGQFGERVRPVTMMIAKSQPEPAKRLGKEGISQLLTDVQEYMGTLAESLVVSPESIQWHEGGEGGQPFPPLKVRSSVHSAMYADMEGLADIYQSAGFDPMRDRGAHAQSLVSPYHFFSEDKLTGPADRVRKALTQVQRAKSALGAAQKAHSDDEVLDLFD